MTRPRTTSREVELYCDLSHRITEAKCALYLTTGTGTCLLCAERLHRRKPKIDKGDLGEFTATPILRFYLTATTGKPGIEERALKMFARSYTPPTQQQRFEKIGKSIFLPPPEPEEEVKPSGPVAWTTPQEEEIVQPTKSATTKIIRRRKKTPLWVDKCSGCRRKKEIIAWGLCRECKDAGK